MFRSVLFVVFCCLLYPVSVVGAQESSAKLESTVILISIDGMGIDYAERFAAPTLSALAQRGLVADALRPVFPSKTFPNHYSLVTGLHPQNHGVVDNTMYDAGFDAVFSMGRREEVENPRWWGGEPIWVSAEKQGLVSATFFFPGSETAVQGVRPSYWFTYDGSIPNRERVDTVLNWLEMPVAERPRMITLYFSDVDTLGHQYGPNAPEVGVAMREVDDEIAYLLAGLQQREMLDDVDLIITSDHGMAEVDLRRHVVIDEVFDTDLAQRVMYSRELVSIFPKEGKLETIVQQLEANLPDSATAYLKSEMPARFHYSRHERIAPIVVLADVGTALLRRSWLDDMSAQPDFDRPRGGHGYDNAAPEMRGVFMAIGPSFQPATRIGEISTVDIYNVMARILKIEPAPNDGDPAVLPLMLRDRK